MIAITITELARSPGTFTVSRSPDSPRGRVMSRDARGPEEAAAVAVEYAMHCESRYTILGSAKVIPLIPPELRSGPQK